MSDERGLAFQIPKEHIRNVLNQYDFMLVSLQVCQEECSELIKAISKKVRAMHSGYKTEFNSQTIVEEVTHVAISLGMLQNMFDITQKEIEQEVHRKCVEEGMDDSHYSYTCLKRSNLSSEDEQWTPVAGDLVRVVYNGGLGTITDYINPKKRAVIIYTQVNETDDKIIEFQGNQWKIKLIPAEGIPEVYIVQSMVKMT